MAPRGRYLGGLFLGGYVGLDRLRRKTFSVLVSGAFAEFGKESVLSLPIRVEGAGRIAIGSGVFIAAGCWLHVEGAGNHIALEIGSGSSIGAHSTLSAVQSVRIGEQVLMAPSVYISDHSHEFSDTNIPVRSQGLTKIGPVEIADGAWLGHGVVVCPGVRIGRGAVIGANSVVTSDVPDSAVAVGAPARVVRVRTDGGSRA
jgi:acetyltransferase-like isoleucine patch superfamily enzyme